MNSVIALAASTVCSRDGEERGLEVEEPNDDPAEIMYQICLSVRMVLRRGKMDVGASKQE